jgi:hypothetical protein
MRVHGQITLALQFKIADRVFGKQRQHMIKERNTRPNFRPALAVNVELQDNAGLGGVSFDAGPAQIHALSANQNPR